MESKELRLSQNLVIKAVDEKDAKTLIIKGKASVYRTPDGFLQIDRDQELMNLDFMDLESFRKNPILIVAHQFDRPIGKVTNIEHRDGALEVTAEVHKLTGEENIFEAVQSGILKSFSISVVPHEFLYRDTHDGEILEIARSTLVEVSLMPVQSNQEALFEVISSKGVNNVGINKKSLAMQNGMTCDELDGSCAFKAEIKGKSVKLEKEEDMSIVKKEIGTDAEKKAAEEKVAAGEKAEADKQAAEKVAADEKAEADKQAADKQAADKQAAEKAEADKVAAEKAETETAKPFDEAALVAAIELAETEKARLAEEKAEADKLAADEAKLQEANAAKAKVETAISYIKEKQQEILDTADEDFDIEKVEEFYELVSDAAEAVEEKVLGAISNLQATA